jgi:hypothetical protein
LVSPFRVCESHGKNIDVFDENRIDAGVRCGIREKRAVEPVQVEPVFMPVDIIMDTACSREVTRPQIQVIQAGELQV